MTFTALSIIQPWPWLILRPDVVGAADRAALRAAGQIKDCENREWETPFRGWALLQASAQRLAKWDYQAAALFAAKRGVAELPLRGNLPYGAVVGAIRIDDCVWTLRSRWFTGPRAFVIGAAVPFAAPVACGGALRFFQLPPDGGGVGGQELAHALAAAVGAAGLARAFGIEAPAGGAAAAKEFSLA